MAKKFNVLSLVLMMLLLLTGSSIAQRRVSFARGRTSATVSGSLNAGGSGTFAVRCFSGQLVTATVRSSNGSVFFDAYDENMYSVMTNHNGDYFITIRNRGRATRYALTIKIP